MDPKEDKEKLNVDSNGTVIVTGIDGRHYDAGLLKAAIAKSPRVSLDPKIEFHDKHFDQKQFPEEWKGSWDIPILYLYEGKYSLVYYENPSKSFKKAILLTSFNLKKAKYISPEERSEIEKENQQLADERQQEARTSWDRRTPTTGFENRPRVVTPSKGYQGSKPRFNSRG